MSKFPCIGLIDSGVSTSLSPKVVKLRAFYWQDEKVSAAAATPDQLGHGSALAEIIIKQAPQAQLMVAQVFHQRLVTTPAQIAAAIDWLREQGVSVINMSFGLHIDRPILQQACMRALAQSIILVGASPAQGKPVYPSAYPGVLRATGDARCRPDEFSWLNSSQADFGGCVRSSVENVLGASVGAAYISGHIGRYLSGSNDPSGAALQSWLTKKAKFWGAENRFELRKRTQGELNRQMIIPPASPLA